MVTANRIVAAAGEAAGFVVGGMDQTGLSQKAGAVVSHLHLAKERGALGSAAVGTFGADLYLSGDILQAASANHLGRIDPGRTIAVIDRDCTPTAAMLQTDVAPPDVADLEQAVADRAGDDRVVFLDAQQIAEGLLGNHLLGNVVLIGAAFQAGGLPLSLAEIEQAIARARERRRQQPRGVRVGPVGRARPRCRRRRAGGGGAAQGGSEHLRPVARRAGGGRATGREPRRARRAAGAHRPARRAGGRLPEPRHWRRATSTWWSASRCATTPTTSGRSPRAVAEAWFKLLTYKDEYEVARLHLKMDYGQVARELGIEGPYAVEYQLHPPVLRRLGLKKKLPMGKPYELGFRALRRMKGLRGTPFDVFGWDRDRRTERAVVDEYEQLVVDDRRPVVEPAVRHAGRAGGVADGDQGLCRHQRARRSPTWRARVAELS